MEGFAAQIEESLTNLHKFVNDIQAIQDEEDRVIEYLKTQNLTVEAFIDLFAASGSKEIYVMKDFLYERYIEDCLIESTEYIKNYMFLYWQLSYAISTENHTEGLKAIVGILRMRKNDLEELIEWFGPFCTVPK